MELLDSLRKITLLPPKAFFTWLSGELSGDALHFIVTANAEILMMAQDDREAEELLNLPETVMTPDGVCVVSAMKRVGLPVRERITGVDIAERLLNEAGERGLKVCLLGAKEEVVKTLAENLKRKYPEIKITYRNGYIEDKDSAMESFAASDPDLVLVALGVPAQEKLIARHLKSFRRGILVGVGGSFDVLSGLKKRAPEFFIRTKTEWVYRIAREPKRLKRFWDNNIKFILRLSDDKRRA